MWKIFFNLENEIHTLKYVTRFWTVFLNKKILINVNILSFFQLIKSLLFLVLLFN